MKVIHIELTVDDLRDALRQFAEKNVTAQVTTASVKNAYGKTVLVIPLTLGGTAEGWDFRQHVEELLK